MKGPASAIPRGAAVLLLIGCMAWAQGGNVQLAEASRLIETGKFDQALALVSASLQRNPADPQALLLEGFALSGLGRWKEAYPAFQKTLALAPRLQPALRRAGISAYNLDRHQEAADLLRRFLAAAPGDPMASISSTCCRTA